MSFSSPLKNIWFRRLSFYFIICVVVITVSHLVFSYFGFLHTDVDSARYMLSALVQSEAAVIAIVATLSLVGVQLAAQSYSVRVVEVFRKTPDLWILLLIYGVTIFWGLGVLKLIESGSSQPGGLSNLEVHISFAYYLGVFVFVALVPYILSTLDLLKPSTVIKVLAEGITEESILSAIDEAPDKVHGKDPIQPIVDIVRVSLMKSDYETARAGLSAIEDRTIHIVKSLEESEQISDKTKLENVLKCLFTHIRRTGFLAANRKVGDPTLLATIILYNYGKRSAERGFEDSTWWAVVSIGRLGELIVELKFNTFVMHTIQSLEEIGKTAVKNFEDVTWWVVFYLGRLGELSAGQKLEYATLQATISLEEIGKTATEHKLEHATWQTIDSLKKVRNAAAEHELEHARQQAEHSIKKIKEAADEERFKFIEEEMVEKSRKEMEEALEKLKELHKYSSV
ncbi:hypothetical protein DRN85_04135 [Methanosarcinales archaeon]|nr:MAG: hypothetical protein DRN85_04135 [Methanosarcinales archaeon]RLI00762.1 MAG: hypothetical protein DRO30_05220 [Candidatus Bathyarchaeota archaeon]